MAAPARPVTGFDAPGLDGVTRGENAGVLTAYRFAGAVAWPALRFVARAPLDWSRADALALPVENPSDTPFDLLLRLDDRVDANGDERSLNGSVVVPPHARVTVVLPLAPTPGGMRGRPLARVVAEPGDLVTPNILGGIDAHHVTALHISGMHAAADRTLLIGAPTLREAAVSAPVAGSALADGFGQAVAGQWPEKVTSDATLRAKLAAAATQTRQLAELVPAPADAWGGLAAMPRRPLKSTGFFHIDQAEGRWVLVTPAGHPFFSLGVDVVRPDNPTLVAGREGLFAALPGAADPLAAFYGEDHGRRSFDIGRANLRRGLGPDWATRWPSQTLARLRAWSFNTLGNWSAPMPADPMPHVLIADVEGASAMVPMGGRSLVDPFDPRFLAVADAAAAALTAGHTDDPGLIGYFSGNELPWGEASIPAEGILAHVLALDRSAPARRALIADLRARYPSAQALATAWGLPAPPDWDKPFAVPARPNTVAAGDIGRFEGLFAERYFSIVGAALKHHDPHHLYLGTRFASVTPAVARACARWCDVVSFNFYGATPAARAALWKGLGKPVLIGEFHFGSLDRGSFWPGMTSVPDEASRGPAYAAYVAAAVADPALVGAHWYQYADEPLTGRPFDGENGHIGLVAVTDIPYAGFVEAVAAANRSALAAFAARVSAPR